MFGKIGGPLGNILKPPGGQPGLGGIGDLLGGQNPIGQLIEKLTGATAQFGGQCQPPVPGDVLKKLLGEEGLKNLAPAAKKAVGEALKGLHLDPAAKKLLQDAGIPGFEKSCGAGKGCEDGFDRKKRGEGLLNGLINPAQVHQQLGQLLGGLGGLPPPVSLSALAPLRLR